MIRTFSLLNSAFLILRATSQPPIFHHGYRYRHLLDSLPRSIPTEVEYSSWRNATFGYLSNLCHHATG